LGPIIPWANGQIIALITITQGLVNSRTINVGAQITPNIGTIRNYLATVDYRIGGIYDETYMVVNNTRIKRMALPQV
jgi:predicted branched-subunit amino acid permease